MAYRFEFSLTVLNSLGRTLYRNFASVIAEAISNSWDAEATCVKIVIVKEKKEMTIEDNGIGMNDNDFQGKFLKVGYARRADKSISLRRKPLGRKGIGKLAMLSISERITIRAKKLNEEEIGGIIDNMELDIGIKNDEAYSLEKINAIEDVFEDDKTGTYLKFEGIKDIVNRPEILRKYMAILFNFSFAFKDERFDIYINDEQITIEDLRDLNESTEYLWLINLKDSKDDFLKRFPNREEMEELLLEDFVDKNRSYSMTGFIAAVFKPSQLQLRGAGEEFRAGLHLFVNGRLRQENLLSDIPSRKIGENYFYGEIHVDAFDDGSEITEDIFTTNREGLIKDNSAYTEFIKKIEEDVQSKILSDWLRWRQEKNKRNVKIKIGELRPEKKVSVNKLLESDEENYREKIDNFLSENIASDHPRTKILISHSSCDKELATIVYNELIEKYEFNANEIIYTSSPNPDSTLPDKINIHDYLRKHFLQDWYPNFHVIFIVSDRMKNSWFASLEAGAAWILDTDHDSAVASDYNDGPPSPLENDHLFIKFYEDGSYKNKVDASKIFNALRKKYQD